jgi:hypothetical protein
MLGEVHRRAEIRRLVQAVDEAVGHGARDELQVPDARQHHRVHEPRAGDDVSLYGHIINAEFRIQNYMPDRGSGTTSSSRSTI